jgi:hypothetical protein
MEQNAVQPKVILTRSLALLYPLELAFLGRLKASLEPLFILQALLEPV